MWSIISIASLHEEVVLELIEHALKLKWQLGSVLKFSYYFDNR